MHAEMQRPAKKFLTISIIGILILSFSDMRKFLSALPVLFDVYTKTRNVTSITSTHNLPIAHTLWLQEIGHDRFDLPTPPEYLNCRPGLYPSPLKWKRPG
jgi:hypothetical protein